MDNFLLAVKTVCAVIGGVAGLLTGGMDGLLIALIAVMAADYLSGVMVAIYRKKLSSKVGFAGIAKKGLILLLVMIGNTMDIYILAGTAMVRSAIICFYLANEGLSILENAGKLGLEYPKKLQEIFSQLREESTHGD